MEKIVLFGRVSSTSDRQNYDRQICDLSSWASDKGYQVEAIFAEKVSGAAKIEDRPEFLKMIDFVKNNNIQKICITELSRLGRDPLQILHTIEILNFNKISLFIHNFNLETLTPDKEINPLSQFLVTILAEIARMERQLIRNRLLSGYQNHRNNGGIVGRKVGYKKSIEKIREEYAEEIKLLRKGYTYNHISQITGINKNTLTKLNKIL